MFIENSKKKEYIRNRTSKNEKVRNEQYIYNMFFGVSDHLCWWRFVCLSFKFLWNFGFCQSEIFWSH